MYLEVWTKTKHLLDYLLRMKNYLIRSYLESVPPQELNKKQRKR